MYFLNKSYITNNFIFLLVSLFFCINSFSVEENNAINIAGKSFELEMEIRTMLNESIIGKSDDDLRLEHEKFKIKFDKLTELKSQLEVEAKKMNKQPVEFVHRYVQGKIERIQAELHSKISNFKSLKGDKEINESRIQFEMSLSELELLQIEFTKMEFEIHFKGSEKLNKPQVSIDSEKLDKLKKITNDHFFYENLSLAISSFSMSNPLLLRIANSNNPDNFSAAVTEIAELSIKEDADYQESLNPKFKAASPEDFLLNEAMIREGAKIAFEKGYLKNMENQIKVVANIFESIIRTNSKKINNESLELFVLHRKREFQDYLAIAILYAQALDMISENSINYSKLEKAAEISFADFIKRTRGILTFTDVDLAEAMKNMSPYIKGLIPQGTSSRLFSEAFKKSRENVNYYEIPDITKMGSKKDRLVSKIILWGSYGGAFLISNAALNYATNFEHPVYVLLATIGLVMMQSRNPVSDTWSEINDSIEDHKTTDIFKDYQNENSNQKNKFPKIRCENLFH